MTKPFWLSLVHSLNMTIEHAMVEADNDQRAIAHPTALCELGSESLGFNIPATASGGFTLPKRRVI